MSWYSNFIDNMAQSNKDYYKEITQEWINDTFEDTTLNTIIKEEKYPFNEQYKSFDVHIDSVSEVSTNLTKVMGDYIAVLFKDCSHRNYRGQKYKWEGETYLCYDKINKLSKVANAKLIRCNNEISWLDKSNGNILTEKVFFGYEVSSTNQQVAKTATVENRRLILYVQGNDKTKTIDLNQRFMFQHSQCYKVEQIDNYNQEEGTNGDVTMIKIYLVYSPLLPIDNKELNVCDYYAVDYRVKIDSDNISQIQGFQGQLTANVMKDNELVTDMPISWSTSDNKTVSIDSNGIYRLIGNKGSKAEIKAYLTDNENIYDTITINIVDDYLPEKKIIISPSDVTELNEMESLEITCGVYIEGEKQNIAIQCIPSGADSRHYQLEETIDGFKVTNLKMDKNLLTLTFKADGCDDVELKIKLKSLL